MESHESEQVDEDLLPAWKIARSLLPGDLSGWTVQLRAGLDGDGLCTPDRREILVSANRAGTERVVTVVHERAHALTGSGHGAAWQTLMAQAISRCQDPSLRLELQEDLDNYAFTRSTGVRVASGVVWSAAKLAAAASGTDLAGLFAVAPDLRSLCTSFEKEGRAEDRKTGVTPLPTRGVPGAAMPPPSREAARAAIRTQVRRAVDYVSRYFAAQRPEVLATFPELAVLLESLEVGQAPELWPELDPQHFA